MDMVREVIDMVRKVIDMVGEVMYMVREVMDMVGEVMDMVGPMIGVILDRKDSFSLLHSYYSRGHFKTFTYYIKLEQITQQDILYSLGQTRPSWREADAVTMFFLITTFHTQFPLFQK